MVFVFRKVAFEQTIKTSDTQIITCMYIHHKENSTFFQIFSQSPVTSRHGDGLNAEHKFRLVICVYVMRFILTRVGLSRRTLHALHH